MPSPRRVAQPLAGLGPAELHPILSQLRTQPAEIAEQHLAQPEILGFGARFAVVLLTGFLLGFVVALFASRGLLGFIAGFAVGFPVGFGIRFVVGLALRIAFVLLGSLIRVARLDGGEGVNRTRRRQGNGDDPSPDRRANRKGGLEDRSTGLRSAPSAGRGRAAGRHPYARIDSDKGEPPGASAVADCLRAIAGTIAASSPAHPNRRTRCPRA